MSELLIALISLVVAVGGTSVCMLTEGLKVKAMAVALGLASLRTTEVESLVLIGAEKPTLE